MADVLSPTFAELVTPGASYVGGNDFFLTRPSLAKVIPASEIPTPTNVLTSPPASLQSALRFFLLGAAVHYVTDQKGNRSMMVHPSQQTGPHADYKDWVEASVHRWKDLLELPETDPAYRACADLFRPEYAQLKASSTDLPEFDALIDGMSQVIGDTRILQVNSTNQGEKDVKWSANDYWILIGGQKLDRGFTVEGLTVTYMPRPIGSGNADTLQQRARFFGYKSLYKGLCRVFLIQAVLDAFKEYIEHEEFIRGALTEFRGRPLVEWKRDFILDGIFSPTRPSVISLDVDRVSLDEGWAYPGRLHKDDVAILPNTALFQSITTSWKKTYGIGDAAAHERFKDKRRDSPRNLLIQDVPLANVVKDLLLNVRIPDYDDSSQHTALTLALSAVLKKNPDELCDVFLIAELQAQTRSLTSTDRPNNLFSGKSPNVDDFDQLLYVGDRALFSAGRLSLHLRTYDLLEHQNPGSRVAKDVPWFAVHLPAHFAKAMVIEARP
ncbi:MAG: Z1 domain-containing protein [Panacagrimonas sp.]